MLAFGLVCCLRVSDAFSGESTNFSELCWGVVVPFVFDFDPGRGPAAAASGPPPGRPAKISAVGENLSAQRKSRPRAKISCVGENLGC